jgi:hypothetical protein
VAADVDPEALTVVASVDADMAVIQANREAAEVGAEQWVEKES